jgi:hypothetical protein
MKSLSGAQFITFWWKKMRLPGTKKKHINILQKKIETRGHSFVVVKNQYVLLSQP